MRKIFFVLGFCSFTLLLLFTSCEQEPATTKRDRLTLFVVSLNSLTRSNIEGNFVGGSSANRAAFAGSLLPEGESYTWVESGSLSDKITGEFRKVSDGTYNCTAEFFFSNTQNNIFESEQWMIEKMEIWDSTESSPDHFIYQ